MIERPLIYETYRIATQVYIVAVHDGCHTSERYWVVYGEVFKTGRPVPAVARLLNSDHLDARTCSSLVHSYRWRTTEEVTA